LYQAHKRDLLGVDIGIMYRLANTIYSIGQVSREMISMIPHNMKSYLTLDIGNQRYMDSLQLMPGSLDFHISNLGAEPCKEEVNKDGNSLNLPCKKPSHLYRIDSDRYFAHSKRFSITREHGPKGRDNLVFQSEEAMKKLYTWLLYVDANTLYTGAMMQAMPTGRHRWITAEETPNLFNKISKSEIPDNADKGYILKVDLDYPYKLHKAHFSYPLAPENIEISKEEMSKCEQEIINDLKHYTKTKKLVPNFNNKKKPEGELKKFKKLVVDPSYKSHRILAEKLVGISRYQSKARLSKSIFIGMSVLDENMVEMQEHFDFSDYKPEHPIYQALGKEKIMLNKKVPDRRAKRVQKVVIKKNLTHDMYEDCLKS
ncbi:8878_t:CDS:2, partial [Gigaspora margarita]